MKTPTLLALLAGISSLLMAVQPEQATTQTLKLEEVAVFPNQQVTGVTVSKTGRIFVNFPFWSDDHTVSVMEILPDGNMKPYPGPKWNSKDTSVKYRFVCVQSVYVDDEDILWILDAAAPKMETVVPGEAKLVKVDLTTNKVVKTYRFDDKIAPSKSYLNDIRVDTTTHHAFITESGTGAIIVLDLTSGKARRLLDDHASTKAEDGIELIVDGITVIDPASGKPPQIHADGIALDKEGGWLYYHALTGRTLYRIKTADLLDPSLKPEELGKKVENLAMTPAPDGMMEAGNGSLYLTALETNAIIHFEPKSKEVATLIEDPLLQWPDTLSLAADGHMYVTTSQIHRMPKYNGGQSQQKGPFALYRFKLNPPSSLPTPLQKPLEERDSPLPTSSSVK